MTPAQISEARGGFGLTLIQWATMLGISRPQAHRIEQPRGVPSHRRPSKTLIRLIQAYQRGPLPEDWPRNLKESENE